MQTKTLLSLVFSGFAFALFAQVPLHLSSEEVQQREAPQETPTAEESATPAEQSPDAARAQKPAQEPRSPILGLTGDEIIKLADEKMVGETARFLNQMIIKRPGMEDMIAKYETTFQGRGEKVLLRMLFPPEEAGKDLLLLDENMWQYIPKLERSMRVAGKQRFMGSDFDNADLLKVSLVNDYSGTFVGIEKIKGREYFFVKLEKKRPQATYDRVDYWVDREKHLPFREVYYTRSGKKIKTLQYLNVGLVGNRQVPKTLVMISELRPNNLTVVQILEGNYNLPVDPTWFTRAYLERKRI